MALATKEALLAASDIREREIELPSIGMSVRVRALSAAYSNQALQEAAEMQTTSRGEQVARFSVSRLDELKILHGLVEPKLDSIDEARQLSQQIGPAWKEIIVAIDELSAFDSEAVAKANDSFRAGGQGEKGTPPLNGASAGGDGPDIPARTGAPTPHAGRGDV